MGHTVGNHQKPRPLVSPLGCQLASGVTDLGWGGGSAVDWPTCGKLPNSQPRSPHCRAGRSSSHHHGATAPACTCSSCLGRGLWVPGCPLALAGPVWLLQGCGDLTSSCSSSLSSSLTTGLARDPRLGRRRPPFSRSCAFSFRPSLIFTLTERAAGDSRK